jgi:hypothetical protein
MAVQVLRALSAATTIVAVDTAPGDLNEDLPRSRLRRRRLAQLGWLLPGDKLECSHRYLLNQ